MANDAASEDPALKKSGLKKIVLALLAAGVAGGGAFYAVSSGMILASSDTARDAHGSDHDTPAPADLPDVAFVPLDPIVVSLPNLAETGHLRFRGHLEVVAGQQDEVVAMTPRIMDVLNSYLRAVSPEELAAPEALIVLRAQMLRRVQLVIGEGRVRDLLVMEFVLT